MAAGLPEEKWKEVYANLKTFHDKAYTVIDAAIKLEEEDKKDQALQKYEEGLGLIDLALELRVECPSNPDLTWEKGCVMLQKMRKTKKEMLGRIADIQVRQPPDPNLLPPPSYDEAMSLSPSLPHVPPTTPVLFPPYVNGGGVGGGGPSFPSGAGASSLPPSGAGASSGGGQPASFMTYQQLGEALNNLKVETDMQSAQVIYTHDNVRLYFISNEGVVSSSSEPSVLRILQLEDGTDKEPLFYLQVGDWFYPLVPNVSPCFRSEYGAFILPDVHGEDVSPYGNSYSTSMTIQRYPFLSKERSAVGIMLPPDADKSVYNLLEDILHCIVTTEPIAPPRHRVKRDETRSAAVSRSIVSDKHRHKKRSHRDPEDGEKKSHRRHRRHHRRHHDDEDVVDDGESVTSSSKDSHRRHRGKKHHGYDLLPKSRHSKHLYGVPVFGNYRTVLGVKPSEMVVAKEEKPQKLLGEKKVEKEGENKVEKEVEKKEKEVEKKEKGEKEEEEEEEDSDESSSSEGSSDSEDTVEEAEEVALDPKEEKRRRKEEYKEEKRRRKEEYKRSISKGSSSSGGQGKRRGKRFVLASKYRAPGAQYISSGLVRGAEKASEYINSSTPRLLEKITPDPTPRQVSPGLAKGAEVARNVTGTAVVVTGYVANKVGSATMALGRYLAPHIQKGGTRLAGVAGVDEATAAARVEGAMTLAAGAVEGFSTVYTGLEQAGSILGNSLTNNTVHIVEHKYGQPMGQVTGHTLHSIGNAYAASQNFRIFTPKNLAKKTAKDAGKAFVEDFRAELRNHNSTPQQNHHSLMQQQNHNSLMQQQNYNSMPQQQNHNSLMQQQNYNSMPPQYQMNGDQKPPLDKPGPSKS